MDRVRKPEPGSPPPLFATTSPRNLRDMSVSELVAVLRPSFRSEDYDKVQEVLERRFLKLEFERLGRIQAEEELRKKKEECVRGERVQESYEILLKRAKEVGGLAGGNDSVQELKNKKNAELENENFELKEMKKKLVDDVAELRKKNVELFCENHELKVMKDRWVNDSDAVAELRIKVSVLEEEKLKVHNDLVALRRKNSELEEAGKKDLATLEELKAENRKLAEENRGVEELRAENCELERKFEELHGWIARVEGGLKLLTNAEACGGGDFEGDTPGYLMTSSEVNDEEEFRDYELENVTAQTSSKGCKDAALGTSDVERVKLESDIEIEVINLVDDDDGCTSKRSHGKKPLSGITIKNGPGSSSGEVHQKDTPLSELRKRKLTIFDYVDE